MKYFTGEIYGGVSLRSTVASGNDVERERIYDMIFRLPWRCEVVKQTLALFFISECDVLGLATCVIHIFKNFNAASTHWLFCLRQLISVIVDCHANKSPADILGCF